MHMFHHTKAIVADLLHVSKPIEQIVVLRLCKTYSKYMLWHFNFWPKPPKSANSLGNSQSNIHYGWLYPMTFPSLAGSYIDHVPNGQCWPGINLIGYRIWSSSLEWTTTLKWQITTGTSLYIGCIPFLLDHVAYYSFTSPASNCHGLLQK